MKNGYKVFWTDNALDELKENWTNKELKKLAKELDKTLSLISQNPNLFPFSDKKQIRKAVVKKLNTIYFRVSNTHDIEILSFFSNRQHPKKRKI